MEPHHSILRRVAVVLLIYFGLHVLSLVGDLVAEQTHAYTIDLLALVLGLLLLRGSLRAARFSAFVYSLAVAVAIGGLLALALVALLRLGPSIELPHAGIHEWLLIVWTSGWWIADVGVTAWIVRELCRPEVEAALVRAGRGSTGSSMRRGAGVGLALAALVLPAAIVLQRLEARVQPLAFAAAEQRIGAGWDMHLASFSSGPNRWVAHVVAHRGDDVRELDVGDPPVVSQ